MNKELKDIKNFDALFEANWEASLKEKPNKAFIENDYKKLTQKITFSEKKKKSTSSKALPYAAIFTGILALNYFIFFFNSQEEALIKNNSSTNFYTTNNTKKIELLDKSTITLFQNSKLNYLADFNVKDRQVELMGSANFNITKNSKKPFIIRNNNLNIKVLGTSFSVIQDSIKQLTKVSLFTGSIELYNNEGTFKKILLPGDVFEFSKNPKKEEKIQNTPITKPVLAEEVIHQKITLSFENTPLHKAYKLLSKKIGVPITTDNLTEYKNLKISLEYKEKPALQILKDLNSFGNYTYSIKDNTIIISSN